MHRSTKESKVNEYQVNMVSKVCYVTKSVEYQLIR